MPILTLCFFIAGYFYEIESALIKNHIIQHNALLCGGKGEVTKYFILEGFQVIAHKILADNYIDEHQITKEELQEMYKLALLKF
jgi:hypothetical protein